jgi:hypothetical protein
VSVVSLSALVLTGCGSSSDALGNQACVHVERFLTLFRESTDATGPTAASLDTDANIQLRDALQPASIAAGADGNWQALAATLSESSRVKDANLVNALSDECAASPAGPRN